MCGWLEFGYPRRASGIGCDKEIICEKADRKDRDFDEWRFVSTQTATLLPSLLLSVLTTTATSETHSVQSNITAVATSMLGKINASAATTSLGTTLCFARGGSY